MRGKMCGKCKGTGKYMIRKQGRVFADVCYPCKGKGIQSVSDQRRNWGYAQFQEQAYEQRLAAERAQQAEEAQAQDGAPYQQLAFSL